jgi:di/tricarboxylate transporter
MESGPEHLYVFGILASAMVLFVWGVWRYDLVAVLALLACVFIGVVPPEQAFHGFGHPAVITVAAVLIISHGLQASGVVDALVRLLARTRRNLRSQIFAGCAVAAALSAFMNNVGALALMLPVVLRNAHRAKRPPSQVLMPLSFATLLGGLVTMIGTPPNIVIATYRESVSGAPFGMFDFAPVGLVLAVVGVLYISLFGWRLIPRKRHRDDPTEDLFQSATYVTEVEVPDGSQLVGRQVRNLESLCENEINIMSIIRPRRKIMAPANHEPLLEGDLLLIQGDPALLDHLISAKQLLAAGERHSVSAQEMRSEDVRMMEAVVMPNSKVEGQSMRGIRLHERFGFNLIAVARRSEPPQTRLRDVRFHTGDVLLLQGERNALDVGMRALGLLPIADRGLHFVRQRRLMLPISIFAVAILAASFGFLSVPIAFVSAVAMLILTGVLNVREVYDSIEWPVIVLLGCLIPVGEALQSSGGTDVIAEFILSLAGDLPSWLLLGVLMATCMLLSDLIHNTPTAVIMAPVAVGIADILALSPDAFLMAVAIGAASPYLTPIGHQSNTLVMAPGGYHFGDYARVGLPMDILILAIAVPMVMWVWMP